MLTSMMCAQMQNGGVELLGEHEYEIVVERHPFDENCCGYSAVDRKGTYGKKTGGDGLLKEFSVIHIPGGIESITVDLGEAPSNYQLGLDMSVERLYGIPCRNGKFEIYGSNVPPLIRIFYYLEDNLGQKIKFKVFVTD